MKVTLKTVTKHRISLKYFSRQILGKQIECKGWEHLKGAIDQKHALSFPY